MIGAAHGRTIVCMQILLSDSSYAPKGVPIVEWVLALQIDNGNWPNSLPGSKYHKDYLIQFCHGVTE
jgi:hypothetical protein